MKNFGNRFLCGCLTVMLLAVSKTTVYAKVSIKLKDDFSDDYEYIYETEEPVDTISPTIKPTIKPTSTPSKEDDNEFVLDWSAVTGKDEDDEDYEPEPTEKPHQIYKLEKPNVSYYSYYDRMQWEKSHLKTNLIKYDEKNGAEKARNNKIPVRTVKYSKNKNTITIKAKYNTCFILKLKGVKSYKRINHTYKWVTYEGKRIKIVDQYFDDWDKLTAVNGKKKKCVVVDFSGTRTFGFLVNGKVFKVKVKSYGDPAPKSINDYKGKGFTSKYTWKTLMVNTDNVFRHRVSLYDAIGVPEKVVDANSYSSGRTRYCKWDKDYFYVQGFKLNRPRKWSSCSFEHTYTYMGVCIDNAINNYKIPSASKMTKEQCCKWIRRNSKLLKIKFLVDDEHWSVKYAVLPILKKALDYSLSDKYTKNSLLMYHIYGNKPKGTKWQEDGGFYYINNYLWDKTGSSVVNLGYFDSKEDYFVDNWAVATWIGKIYYRIKGENQE